MKIAELRTKTKDQLNSLLKDFKKEAFNLRFQKISGSLTNTSRIRYVRKMVAKIKTILNNNLLLKSGEKKNA